jgi:hypothetical protein
MMKLIILNKAKYIKRWKGKNGKWKYKYPEDQKSGKSDVTQTKEFRNWFRNSKVVDKQGKPLVVYHGTPVGEFSEFMTDVPIDKRNFIQSKGAFFSSSTNTASEYTFNYRKMLPAAERLEQKKSEAMRAHIAAKQAGDTELAQKYNDEYYKLHDLDMKTYPDMKDKLVRGPVYPVYLSIQNPLIVDAEGKYWYEVMPDIYKKDLNEYDGIVFKNMIEIGEPQDTYVVFKPEQVKSKFNQGTFNLKDPKINKSLQKAKYLKRWKGKDGKWRYKYPDDGNKKQPMGKDLAAAIKFTEDHCLNFYDNKREIAITLDSKGRVLTETHGEENYVQFSPEDLQKLRGARVAIHNHPMDISFSKPDMSFAIINGVQETRVISEKYIYSYVPDKARVKGLDKREIQQKINEVWDTSGQEHTESVYRLYNSGVINRDEANGVYQHRLMESFAKNFGGTYKREKRK